MQDRDGAEPLLRQARRLFLFVKCIIGDADCQTMTCYWCGNTPRGWSALPVAIATGRAVSAEVADFSIAVTPKPAAITVQVPADGFERQQQKWRGGGDG